MAPVSAALLVLILLVASFTDIKWRVVPNELTGGAALCGLLVAIDGGATGLAAAAASGLAVSFPLLAVSLARPAGLGMGDVKLVAVLGLFLGLQALPALLAGLLMAAFAGVLISLGSRRPPSQVTLPLAPFITVAALPAIAASL